MTDLTLPPDEAARERIRRDLDTTLFVDAGAGSGKTTALVDRVVELVASGAVELRNVAAITFTEKAGAELRDRVRQELQERPDKATTSPEEAARCRVAVEQLDGAAIGTLHSFAQRILSEHPVEAQLPPRVEVSDEVSSGIAFDRRWARVLDELLADPTMERTILLLDAAGVRPNRLRSLALAFDASWDLVEARVPHAASEPPSVASHLVKLDDAMDELRACLDDCVDHNDKLALRIGEFDDYVTLLKATRDDVDLMELLGETARVRPGDRVGNVGAKGRWRIDLKDVRAKVGALGTAIEEVRRNALEACVHHLASAMRRHTLDAARARRDAGRLEFHDLLVLARQVLNDPVQGPVVRASLRERYQRLLLDEFQDTDPIQIELAVRIACADPTTANAVHWADIEVEPGRLFVVGDPKQSIYRFRRADIQLFMEAEERFTAEAGGAVTLSANFRTVEPIISWVNHTFERLMTMPADTDVAHSQPPYSQLDAQRGAPPDGPPVAVVGAVPHPKGTRVDVLREAEAGDVAHAITQAMQQQWPVFDKVTETWGAPTLGDITVLVPARTSLPFLETALAEANIPFRTESSSLVYASRAVRDLMLVLRAADDPTDHLTIVSALRTPLLGCGDDDLLRFKIGGADEAKGTWSYNTPQPQDPAAGPVQAGLAFLRELHEARHWQSPAELLDRIARERRALELGFAEGRPRDIWRRLRFVIDQARAWSEAAGGSLRSYLHWVTQQTVEGARVTESVLPETDDDAVKIMTIHAAKGLEFPITIVSGMSSKIGGNNSVVDVVFPRDGSNVGYKLGKGVATEEFEAWTPIDEQMGYDERIRLLYVACTRACDHLVVSLHRTDRPDPDSIKQRTNAEALVIGIGDLLDDLTEVGRGGDTATPLAPVVPEIPSPPPPFAAWDAERAAALAVASRPGAVAATALTDDGHPDTGADARVADPGADDEVEPGLQKRPRDLDLPPWLKGRYGTAVGRAVHGVLQTIDLRSGDGLEAAVAAQCQAEAVPDRVDVVRGLVIDALGAPVVQAAAAAPHWREVYACTPIADRLLEGYVDLLYRAADGLVVVDYKTSARSAPDELDRRVEGYRLQGAAYAVSVGRATAEPVARVVFLFLTPDGAISRELTDLSAAMADVERLVTDGSELVTA